MKVLLTAINAKYIHSNLAVYNLKAYAEQALQNESTPEIQIAEFTINHRTEYIREEIYKRKPDIVAFSCYIWNIEYVREVSADLKKLLPDIPIWVGGPEVSYDADAFLKQNPHIDLVMLGEGERIFSNLLVCSLNSNEDNNVYIDIKGVAFRRGEEICVTEPEAQLGMDEIPFCYRDMQGFQNKIIYYESSRGCPFSCSYCLSSIDKKLRFRSLELVKKELQFFIDRNVPQVKFVDRTFNCSHSHALELWKFIQEQDQGVTNFHFEIAADLLNEEELLLLSSMRPGLVQLEIGVQSVNLHTLSEINRSMDLKQVKEHVLRIQSAHNIHQHLDLIAGLPYEDLASFRQSFQEIYQIHPQQLQLGFLKVLKGAGMHQMSEEYGLVYETKAPYEVLFTKWISHEELLEIKKVEEMTEIYYNSRQFEKTIDGLEAEYSNAYDLYLALGTYYEKNGLDAVSHSRTARYEILFHFIQKEFKEREEEFKERLAFDLYAREKLKSRPSFLADNTPYKETIRAFYEAEKKEHRFLNGYQGFNSRQMNKMTHIEVFYYTFPEEAENGHKTVKQLPYGLLFDYRNRDPLNHSAAIITLCGFESV